MDGLGIDVPAVNNGPNYALQITQDIFDTWTVRIEIVRLKIFGIELASN